MVKFLIFIITINIFGLSNTVDNMFKRINNDLMIKKEKNKSLKSLIGTWITDSHIAVELIKEGNYYVGIVKSDPYDSTSTFLNGESILRFGTNAENTQKGRLKRLNKNKFYKEWIDTNFKVSDHTIFDGYNLYKKVLDSNIIIKKKRINKKNIQLRLQATKQLKSSDWKQRLEGINTIIKLNDYTTIPQLTPLLFDQNDSVRKATYFLLVKFNTEKDIAGLSELLEESKKVSNSRKKRENNTTIDGIWTSNDNSIQIYLGTDNLITIKIDGKNIEKGLYISDGENQLAIQLDNDSEQVLLNYQIQEDSLYLKSPNYKNELLLKKLK
jgi:hypothetical protein